MKNDYYDQERDGSLQPPETYPVDHSTNHWVCCGWTSYSSCPCCPWCRKVNPIYDPEWRNKIVEGQQ